MRSVRVLTCIVIASLCAQPQSTQQPVQLTNTALHIIPANAVSDTFRIEVALPSTYSNSSASFPVLYLLDSDKSFGLAHDVVGWLTWAREMPQIIVVGISYGGTTRQWWDKRSRDYSPTKDTSGIWGKWPLAGGAGAFKAFVKTELFPFIERTYRTVPNDRAIVGLSLGGLFATYALFTDPAMFHRYIIVGPGLLWDNKRAFDYEAEFYSKQSALSARVFTAVGSRERDDITQPWQQFNAVIASRKYKNLIWSEHTFPDETHISVFPGALSRGLKFVYSK